MAVLQGEQARQAMARMQRRAQQISVGSAPLVAALHPVAEVTAATLLRQAEDAKRACA